MISIKKIATVSAAAGLLLGSAMPALAFGDGGTPWWHHKKGVKITQSNNANVTNNVGGSSNTGNNTECDPSCGGDKTITTGDATTGVAVSTVANSNVASVDPCACLGVKKVRINQSNSATVYNDVDGSSNTGWNSIGGPSFGGDKKIVTGDAVTGVAVSNVLNENIAVVGSGGI